MISRRGVLLGAGAGLAGLSACGGKDAPASDSGPAKVTIGLTYIPNVQFSPFYVAVDQGLFRDAKLDATLRHHGQQEDLFGAVLGGTEDVVFASADEAMVAASKGQDLRTFATAYQTYPIEVMGLKPLADLAALKGASLGIPGHYGSNYYAALVALHSAGLAETDVKLTDIGYTQVSALTTGKIDFIVAFRNNELVQLKAQGHQVTTLPISAEAQLVGPSLITKGDGAGLPLKAIAEVMAEAEKRIIEKPEIALEATAKHVPALADPAQRAAAEQVLKATSELWLRDGRATVAVDEASFTRMGQALRTAGIITEVPKHPWLKV